MSELEQFFCPNEHCKDYGVRCQGNIAFRGKYGKDKSRDLLYCRTCSKRFASTHDSALFGLHLSAETIRQIRGQGSWRASHRTPAGAEQRHGQPGLILRAGEHCAYVLSGLLTSLKLTEVQLDELWTFIKKEKFWQRRRHRTPVQAHVDLDGYRCPDAPVDYVLYWRA